jgi:hemerythrin-like domain-containing protein
MSELLDPDRIAKDPKEIRDLLSILSGKLSIHLAMEDKSLYPELLDSPHESIRETARKYVDEMGGISGLFNEYLARWPYGATIQDHPAEFIQETRSIFTILYRRIEREDNELFPLIDAIDS